MAVLTHKRNSRATGRPLATLRRGVRLLAACAFFALTHHAFAQAPRYKLEAVILFNFAQYVEWPTNAFKSPSAPVVVGVLGSNPFGNALDETFQGETVNNRKLEVRRFNRAEEVRDCHILFISDSEEPRLQQIFDKLRGKPILTVSEIVGFAESGGAVRFVMVGSKIRFRINLEAARQNNLVISSKLLRLAEIVSPEEDR
jgi:hypothetical protein